MKGFLCGLLWRELKKRLLPSWRDFALSLLLTAVFAFACKTTAVGLTIFYVTALLTLYLTPRLAYLIRACMKYRRAREKISGIAGSVGKLADTLKK